MGFGNSPMEPDPFLHHVHPKNYVFFQRHPSGEYGGFQIEYDAEGRVFRGTKSPRIGPAQASCRVALMGDSFTEGAQVEFAQTFAGLLEVAARDTCDVRNYGVRSYSPAIYLVQWTRDVQAWKPDVVFLQLFDNDVADDVSYMRTSVRDPAGLPQAIAGPDGGWLLSQLRRSYVARFVRMVFMRIHWVWLYGRDEQWTVGGLVEEHPALSGATPDLVRELHRRVTAAGSRLVIMAVPSRYRLVGDGRTKVTGGDFHDTIKRFTAANGMEFLDLYQPFARAAAAGVPLFFVQDLHFRAEGHILVAATIARAFPQFFTHAADLGGASVTAAFPAR
jgi:hypothetical protein